MSGLSRTAVAKPASENESDIETPLTLEAKAAGTIQIENPKIGMQYAINGGTKNKVDSSEYLTINVNVGDKVQFYGNGTAKAKKRAVRSLTGPGARAAPRRAETWLATGPPHRPATAWGRLAPKDVAPCAAQPSPSERPPLP